MLTGQPFLHKLGVMIARVVEKDMDERQHPAILKV